MASYKDKTCNLSMSQMSCHSTISAAAPPPMSDHEVLFPRNTAKRGLDIDLNVAPPEEQDFSNLNEGEIEIDNENRCEVSEEEIEIKNRRWEAVLDVGEIALREYEENIEKKEGKSVTRKKRTNWVTDGLRNGSGGSEECTDYCVVVRSSRGRTVAMPNKYRDSVLEPVAVSDFCRVNKKRK